VIENICIVEDKEDFNLIFNKFNKNNCIYVPVDIETFLLCKNNNLNIFDYNKNLSNQFHRTALIETERFKKNLKFKNVSYSLKSEIIGYLRFRLHSIIFIIEIIEKIFKDYKIKKIIVSGLKKENHFLHKAKLCSEIITELFPNLVFLVKKEIIFNDNQNIYSYKNITTIKNLEKNILMSNGGYNFRKISTELRKSGYTTFLPLFDKISLFKKISYFIKGFKLIYFKKDNNKFVEKENFIEKISFVYKFKYDVSSLLNVFNTKLDFYFNDLNQKIKALKKFINENNFIFLISNIARGLHGSILDKDLKNPSMCIPHGVISKSFNEYDVIYKKIIAEAVFNGESKYFALQSKIIQKSLETHKIQGKAIITGNLIFSQSKKNYKNKKKYVLFATTLKGFTNLQYLGVDMFYEYWKILEELNALSKTIDEKIVVKVHPQFKSCKNNLSIYFKSLSFSDDKIVTLLKDSLLLITLSSGTIEDSLNSKVPVILYDLKNRYKQMECEKTDKDSNVVYYIDDKNKIEYVITKIKNSKKLDFEDYIYNGNIKENINNKFLPIISKYTK
tara:strand:+ start:89 stop:1768 length:1680 start_codon:yes stop_codon:yes gene_type:complete